MRTKLLTSSLLSLLLILLTASPVSAKVCQTPRSDINRDGTVNLFDLAMLSDNFLKSQFIPETDVNQDGKVNLFDFHIFQIDVFATCSQASPVPSPSANPSPSPTLSPSPSPAPEAGVSYSVGNDGMIFKEGQLFFPFGFYHVSDVNNRYNDQLAQDVDKMGQAGFNIVQMSITWDDGLVNSAAARQKAKDHNMVIIASYFKPSLSQWLAGMKNDPVIMAWNTADDFNFPYRDPETTPNEVRIINDNLLNMAQGIGYQTYTYGSGGGYPYTQGQIPHLFGNYKDTNMNFMGVQSYPIGNTDESFQGAPLEESLAYYRYARQQAPGKAIMANMQTFAWSNDNGNCGRFPTSKEIRNMLYGALNEGMNGILAYAYHEECGLRTHAAEWEEMVKLRQEVNGDFLNAITRGTRVVRDTASLTAKNARIHATFWSTTQNNKQVSYVVVLNTNQNNPITTTDQLEIPGNWTNPKLIPIMSDSSRYPRTMTPHAANGKWYLNGEVGAQDVQVYRVEES